MTRSIPHPISDERLDRLVGQLLAERAEDVAVTVVPAEAIAPRIRAGLRPALGAGRRTVLMTAAALMIALVVGTIVVGSRLMRLGLPPNPDPPGLVNPPSNPPLPPPTGVPGLAWQVIYTVYDERLAGEPGCDAADAGIRGSCISNRIWVANADGSGARDLFPDRAELAQVVALSADGRWMIVVGWAKGGVGAHHLVELVGPGPEVASEEVLAVEVINPGCGRLCATDDSFAFSPDGTRLAFVRRGPGVLDARDLDSVIAIMDLDTRMVTELASTAISSPDGSNVDPAWSPDGTRLVFSRRSIGVPTPEDRLQDTALFVVDADGDNLHQLVPTELTAKDAAWSPDGSLIAFSSAVEWLGMDEFGKRENWNVDSDVYTVRPDGSDLRQVTDSGPDGVDRGAAVQQGATFRSWTADGRLVFTVARWAGQGDSTTLPAEVWVIGADGGDARQLDPSSLASLSAVGCVTCPYPPEVDGLHYDAFWRPLP